MVNWESLIAERMRPAAKVVSLEDAMKANDKEHRRKYAAARYQRLKNDPEFNRRRYKAQKAYRQTDDYKAYRNEYMRWWRKNHVETEHERELRLERNRRYKKRKRAAA